MARQAKKFEKYDTAFTDFASLLSDIIEDNEDGSDQQAQVELLLAWEREFRSEIVKRKQSTGIYRKFLQRICVENKNILSARPYFRVGAKRFSAEVTPAIKSEDVEKLKTFDINFRFIIFARDNWLGSFPKKAEKAFQEAKRAREVLVQNNMPLAINRAKRFYRAVPRSHMDLMDFISICAMGLATGIDKWDAPYSKVWRSCCIGFMTGFLIDAYSETMIHFYPNDRKFLYKANKLRARMGISEPGALSEAVNASFKADEIEKGFKAPKHDIDESELFNLMNAASPVSTDSFAGEEGYGVYDFTPDSSADAETAYIARETMSMMLTAAQKLPLLERKILRLKGVLL
jgi:DNA-directed RNA polymerase specialized sigma subunit